MLLGWPGRIGLVLGIVGLSLSLSGAVVIFLFGLPPRVNESGTICLALEQEDESGRKKGRVYRKISRLGLALLVVGFLLQLLERIV